MVFQEIVDVSVLQEADLLFEWALVVVQVFQVRQNEAVRESEFLLDAFSLQSRLPFVLLYILLHVILDLQLFRICFIAFDHISEFVLQEITQKCFMIIKLVQKCCYFGFI